VVNPSSAQRVLIYRLGSLGDTVLALPCFHLVRRVFPAAQISVLTNHPVEGRAAPLAAVLDGSGLIDHVLDYPVGLRSPAQIARLLRQIRSLRFDVVVHLTAARGFAASVRDYLFFRACGIPKVIGVPFERFDLRVREIAPGKFESESARLARRVSELGDARLTDPQSWDLCLTNDEQREADQLLENGGIISPIIAVGVGTKQIVNDWGIENWSRLVAELARVCPEASLIAIGSAEERAAVDSVFDMWNGRSANLCGKTSPRMSAAILRHAAVFIGHDSGPMHLAAAVDTRCVAIFSRRFPLGQWFPRGEHNTICVPDGLCSTCATTGCRQVNGACVRSVPVEQVLKALTAQLKCHVVAA
jgi:heptosyltransferase-3